jgi:glycosyltransferase involved in cell wall biosynthesis
MTAFLAKQNTVEWIGDNVVSQSYAYRSKVEYYPEFYAQLYGSILSERINRYNFDVVIVRDYFLGAYLDVSIPIIYIGDTTFRLFKDNMSLPSKEFEETADEIERKMIENADSVIFSSNWAKESAVNDYSCKKEKTHVVEFGANIPALSEYEIDIRTDACNLVYIGKEWQRKGGVKVLDVYRLLKQEEIRCTLTIIGSTPEYKLEVDNDLIIIPHLDKSKKEDLDKLGQILRKSHFLILPTKFEPFGIVFCEASAYGVPSIAADVGGVSQPVREGKNGFLLPPLATAEDYAEKIKTVFSDKESYLKLRASSRHEYETRLNWDVWSEKVNKILEDTVENYKKKNG